MILYLIQFLGGKLNFIKPVLRKEIKDGLKN